MWYRFACQNHVCLHHGSRAGKVLVHRDLKTPPDLFLNVIKPYREDIVVAVECIFTWCWLADICVKENIPFVLGHALYMKAIHGGKSKNDKIDSFKIATLLRGGTIPMAYVYPRQMRSTRDLLRRRMYLMRKRSELLAHVQNTNSQYNLPQLGKKIAYKANREGVAERFEDTSVKKNIEVDLKMLDFYDHMLNDLELFIAKTAKEQTAHNFYLLRTIPGVGKILALVLLYEIHDISRFQSVQDLALYARLVKCSKEVCR